jgi:hypothetical protein
MTSPGESGVNRDIYERISGTLKIIAAVAERCISSPFTRVAIINAAGSGMSCAVVIQGPNPAVSGKFFPGVI